MSSSNCCFLICIQVYQEVGQVVWYLLKNFPQFIVIHTVEGFGVVSKAEIDVFLELSCFFDDPVDIGSLISGSSAFSKTSLNICKFMIHVLLKLGHTIQVWPKSNPLWLYSEVRNRFKGLDLIDREPDELWMKVLTLYVRQWSRPSPWKRNAKRQNGCLRMPYKYLWKEEKRKAEKSKDIPIWMQSSKE